MSRERPSNPALTKDIRVFVGTSGSGKSHQMKLALRGHKRALVFDPDREYGSLPGFTAIQSPAEFVRAVKRRSGKGMKLALQAGGPSAFDIFCRVAWWERSAAAPLVVVVDELAGVDRIQKAEGAWHSLLTRGRKYAITILAGAQATQEISKTLVRMRSYLWVGYLERGDDWAYMAKETGEPAERFRALRPVPYCDSLTFKAGQVTADIAKKPRV